MAAGKRKPVMLTRVLLLVCVIATIGPGGGHAQPMSRAAVYRQVAAMTALGRQMFFDPSLSASGRMSCASCHDPAHAFGPPDGLPVRFGGTDLRQPGLRAVPSLMYLQAAPQFTEHFFDNDEEADESVDNGPTGGLTWDGRVDRGRDQARLPLLSSYEMANASPRDVVAKLRAAPYAPELRLVFGAAVLDDDAAGFAALLQSLEVFEEDPGFYPYSSKYDAYLAGRARLSPAEARGLAAFDDPARGNCAQCHISRRGLDGTPPQFTDYGLVAVGVPRNSAIPANTDPGYFDLGLCGPLRTDLRGDPGYCGRFMTPTLRNVATRRVFFHNGVFQTLREVLEFYARRDTDPGRFYPRDAAGRVRTFDDLPAAYVANVSVDPPFNRRPGERPALSESEIDDIIAFLGTLTDGWNEGQ
jgi:cytochrome c peroxidase